MDEPRPRCYMAIKKGHLGKQIESKLSTSSVNADPAFYSLWADGNPLEQSESSLYFTNKTAVVSGSSLLT